MLNDKQSRAYCDLTGDRTGDIAVARATLNAPKANKFGAIKTTVDDIKFDSKAEARRYSQLKLLERASKIHDLRLQPSFKLHAGIKYIADFKYTENGKLVVEDVKGMETAVFRLKQKLFSFDYPYIDFRVIPAKEV